MKRSVCHLNTIDIIILVILGIGLLLGLYRGFLQSLLNLVGSLVSFGLSFLFYPKLANALASNSELIRTIRNYTDSGKLLGSLDLSKLPVNGLSAEDIAAVVQKANLPEPLGSLLKSNLSNQVFSPMGDLATTVGDYVNQTLVSTCLNVLSFLLCFLICFLIITIIINLFRKVLKLPVLRLLDSLAGGVAGVATGFVVCLALFALLPLLKSFLPLEGIDELISSSNFAHFFQNSDLIIAIMNQRIL